ncbi:SDR family NAD(P)-dependent oxidoreductase [Nocardioides sp. DS6]|uniref:SDR family NAD(P)-dependent oxidoreductase n=1 Tax=Nocardioides eburneus TaxID=3231482 RepID=A0ABV3T3Y9_9ACTN
MGITDFEGRVVVVTGGASGIGRGMVERFGARGAQVVIADLDGPALERAAAETGSTPVATDVADAASVAALADRVLADHGRVDIVCNNAGVGPRADVSRLTLGDWEWVLRVNLFGVIHGVHAFLPHLRANPRGGWIVNTASMSRFVFPPGYAPYVTSKAGVEALSLVLAKELAADGADIGVTVLHPGAVHTDIKHSLRSRPAALGQDSGLVDFDLAQQLPASTRWSTPAETGELVVRAVERGELYALTHPEQLPQVRATHAAVEEAFEQAATVR